LIALELSIHRVPSMQPSVACLQNQLGILARFWDRIGAVTDAGGTANTGANSRASARRIPRQS
jgi:hypothetical protein